MISSAAEDSDDEEGREPTSIQDSAKEGLYKLTSIVASRGLAVAGLQEAEETSRA